MNSIDGCPSPTFPESEMETGGALLGRINLQSDHFRYWKPTTTLFGLVIILMDSDQSEGCPYALRDVTKGRITKDGLSRSISALYVNRSHCFV